ncbi:HEAT repeat domain-containing protein [Variovorax sp. LjRoot84]|uniref:HEAT repeat domain-containing protein n=1 Tax=Variovorax sp. LjRoot84 TaxID=3342340 RepID=UPI003ECF5A7F
MTTPRNLPAVQLMDLASDAWAIHDAARRSFIAQGAQGIPLLLDGLEDERLGLMAHRRILLILGELGVEQTIPVIRAALHRSLRRDDPIVRSGAMEALAAFRTPEAVGELVALLDHPNPDVVKHAAMLAGHTRAPAVLAPLRQLLASDDASRRHAAAVGLIRMDDAAARAALSEHLARETDDEVRTLIRVAGIGDPARR